LYRISFVSETCGYDLIDKTEKPMNAQNSSYGSERPVVDYERSPGIVRVLLKRLIGDFNVDGDHHDMIRQRPIAQKQYGDVTKGKTRKTKF